MCTLILLHGLFPEAPLILAANRDERLDRPAEPPTLWDKHAIPTLAPRDVEAGGTWLGINAGGVVAAVTNRMGQVRQPHRRSRGELPLAALTEPRARVAIEHVADLDAIAFNPFNLVIADRDEAFVAWSDGVRFAWDALEPGAHVFTEASFGARTPAREAALAETLDRLARASEAPTDEALLELLRRHDPDPLAGTCVHADGRNYGTRSSTLIRLSADYRRVRFLHAEGRPCQSRYQDLGELASSLQERPPDVDGNWNPDD